MPERTDPTAESTFGIRLGQPGGRPDDQAGAGPMRWHASEWGLASLLCAGMVLVSLPVFAIFDLLYWVFGPHIVATANKWARGLVFTGAVFGYVFVLALCLASLAMGIRGLLSAARNGQPGGLAFAGTLLGAAALLAAALLGAGTLLILSHF